jgi:predicted MFS family arabinose efflux permease
LGVTVGAPIIQYFGWRALFWGELPLMAIAAVLAVVVLPTRDRPEADEPAPTSRTSPWSQLDWTGTWSLALSVTAGLLALNEAPSWGFAAPATLAVFGLSVAAGVFFVIHERSDPHPLIPLRYFRMRNFVFPLGARTLVNFSYMGGFFLFPILTERVYGYSETRAGLVSTARPLMFSIVAPIAGYAAVKVGERVSVVAGAVALTISMVMFTQLGAEPSLLVILVALALSGVGNGLSTPATAASASNEVAPDELGVMSAAQQLITQIGIVAGIQVMVTVEASSHGGVGSLASFHRAYAVGAVAAVLAGVCGFFMLDTPRAGRKSALPDVHLG